MALFAQRAAPRAMARPSASGILIGVVILIGIALAGLAATLWYLGPPADPTRASVALPPPGAKGTGETNLTPGITQQEPATQVGKSGEPPAYTGEQALLPAPDPALIERAEAGYLPTIGRDGRMPWKVYARPFNLADTRPRVALVVGWLGISGVETDAAINHLPPEVTLALVPYAKRLGEWVSQARTAGHEVLLNLPMQPSDYPRQDPGPNALLTALDGAQNLQRLHWMEAQATGYVGFLGLMGSQFSVVREDMQPILDDMAKRGLLYVDNRSSPQTTVPAIALDLKLPIATTNRLIDADPTRPSIDHKLADLEDLARRNGSAVGLGRPDPVTLERVAAWMEELNKRGVVLAPVSAIVGPPKPETDPNAVAIAPPPKPDDGKGKPKGEGKEGGEAKKPEGGEAPKKEH